MVFCLCHVLCSDAARNSELRQPSLFFMQILNVLDEIYGARYVCQH